jgi:hypothetical protein
VKVKAGKWVLTRRWYVAMNYMSGASNRHSFDTRREASSWVAVRKESGLWNPACYTSSYWTLRREGVVMWSSREYRHQI